MKKTLLLSVFVIVLLPNIALGQDEVSYDRYGSVSEGKTFEEKANKNQNPLKNAGNHFLVYPFELIRWPADQTLVFTEKHHLYDKADWVYQQMKNHGLKPQIRSLGFSNFGGGFDVEFVQLARLKDRLPNLSVKGSTLWTFDSITQYETKILEEQIAGTGFKTGGLFRYETRGEEHFYGIGPNTSLGDGTSYRIERTTLEAMLGASTFLNVWDAQAKFGYQNSNITNGKDKRRGIIDEIFVASGRQRIPGLGGDEILTWALDLSHDNRDNKDVPTLGGYERLHFSFNKGIESSSGFFNYRAEAAHFFKLFSERRIFALRGVVEENDKVSGRDVPFFLMSRLGGYGAFPEIGDAQRGFRDSRFYDNNLLLFNVEYRWTVWEYKDWKMDTILFWDFGQVFGKWSRFQFDDFQSSVGPGLRVSYGKKVLLALEAARSHEGTELYATTTAPF